MKNAVAIERRAKAVLGWQSNPVIRDAIAEQNWEFLNEYLNLITSAHYRETKTSAAKPFRKFRKVKKPCQKR